MGYSLVTAIINIITAILTARGLKAGVAGYKLQQITAKLNV